MANIQLLLAVVTIFLCQFSGTESKSAVDGYERFGNSNNGSIQQCPDYYDCMECYQETTPPPITCPPEITCQPCTTENPTTAAECTESPPCTTDYPQTCEPCTERPPCTTPYPATCEPCPTVPACPTQTTVYPSTCPPVVTCPTPTTTYPSTCPTPGYSIPKFSKTIYETSLASWPTAGSSVHLGISAGTPDNDPIIYALVDPPQFVTLGANQDIIFTSTVAEGAFVGPNNVMVIEVNASIYWDTSLSSSAAVIVVFPRG